jgi:hypothetical protein
MKRYRALFLLAAAAVVIFTAGRLLFNRGGETSAPTGISSGATIPPATRPKEMHIPASRTETEEAISAPRPSYRREMGEFREEGKTAGYWVVREDAAGLTLEIDIPAYRLEEWGYGGKERRAAIPGYLSLEEPGEPAVPALVVSVPLPGVESIEISAETSPPRRKTGIRLTSSPDEARIQRELERLWIEKTVTDPGQFSALSPPWQEFFRAVQEYHQDQAPPPEDRSGEIGAEREEDWYPARVVESSEPLWAGEEQFVNLRVAPLRYSAAEGILESREKVTVEIAYGAPAKTLPKRTETEYGAQFELAASPDSFRSFVTEDGIQVITYQDLVDAGFNIGQDPRALRGYFRGEEIAIHVEGEDDGTWDPEDYLAFWGEGDPGFYTQTGTYWLYQTAGTGLRMETVASPRSGRPSRQENFLDHLHLEERVSYQPYLPVGTGNDCWFWDFAGYTYGTDYISIIQFTLAGVSDRKGTASFGARLFGYNSYPDYQPDHHTLVHLNGQLLGDFTWDGRVFYNFQTDISQDHFLEGVNTITIREANDLGLPISGEFVLIDSFDLAYYRDYSSHEDRLAFSASGKGDYRVSGFTGPDLALYQVTNPEAPRRITQFTVQTGGNYTLDFRKWEAGEESYWAGRKDAAARPPLVQNSPSDLVSSRTVDYIIVTHPDFRAAVQPLADFRKAGGLEVEIFEIGDIYTTFGFGDFTPLAIQRFLQYAYTEWDSQTRPRYTLLVGDGNYDYQNYLGASPANYLPPYMAIDPYMETAADNWYTCLIGDDRVPDIDLGRMAVNTAAQAEVMVQKTIDYELSTDGLAWQRDVLMVADNPDPGAGDFPADSDWLIANYLPPAFTAQTAYVSVLGVAGTRTSIINGINSGKLLVNYIGHGSTSTWADPYIFRSSSIASLTNADKLNLLVTPTCLNGYWCDVSGSCLAEDMTRTAGKGSVAAVSSTGLSLNTPARQLTGFLFEELLDEERAVGEALTRAKARLAGLTPWLYMLDIYMLFGDPALELK